MVLVTTAFVFVTVMALNGVIEGARRDFFSSFSAMSNEIDSIIERQLANPLRGFPGETAKLKPVKKPGRSSKPRHSHRKLSALIPAQCLAYYPLVEHYGAHDASRNGYNGKLKHTTEQKDSPFAAVRFSGISFSSHKYVRIDAASTPLATLGSASFTISMFVKLTVDQFASPLVEYSYRSFDTPATHPLSGMHFYFYPNSRTLFFQTMACDPPSSPVTISCPTDGTAAWLFVASVYDKTANSIQIYCDSATSGPVVMTPTAGCPSPKPLSTDLLYLGYRPPETNGEQRLEGRMACVSICQGAMTKSELDSMKSLCKNFF